jgi:hypothetical protein
MGYGLLYGSQCNVQTLEEFFFQSIVTRSILTMIESDVVQIIEFVEDKINLHIHENKIVKSIL